MVQIGACARTLIASQAPGRRAHHSVVPFADRAGDNLSGWLGLDGATIYAPELVAIFADRPVLSRTRPTRRPAAAPRVRAAAMPEVRLPLLLGRHAQAHHLGARRGTTPTATLRAFRNYLPKHFPLPHPSRRNGPWLLRHSWFEDDVLPALRAEVDRALSDSGRR